MTDRRRLAAGSSVAGAHECLLAQIRFAAEAGVDVVQVREPDLPPAALAALVRHAMVIVQGTRTRIVVNERVDVAIAAGAHGVHLRGESPAPSVVRTIVPAGFLVGRSVHGVAAAMAAGDAVDYLVAGTVWESDSKPAGHHLLGTTGLAEVVRAVAVPVLAIGGLTVDRLPDVARAGGAGAAAIGLFIGSPGPAGCRACPLEGVVRRARQMFDMGLRGS